METTVKKGMTLLAICVVFALSGCASCSKISCATPHAELPETVSPGEILTIKVEDLWICPDNCGAAPVPFSDVTIDAVAAGTGTVVATATASVNDKATAEVSLTIPDDADGSLVIRTSDAVFEFGTVEVVRE